MLRPVYYVRDDSLPPAKSHRPLKLAIALVFSICVLVFSAGQAWEARNSQQNHHHHKK